MDGDGYENEMKAGIIRSPNELVSRNAMLKVPKDREAHLHLKFLCIML